MRRGRHDYVLDLGKGKKGTDEEKEYTKRMVK